MESDVDLEGELAVAINMWFYTYLALLGAVLAILVFQKQRFSALTRLIGGILFLSLMWGPIFGLSQDRQGVVVSVEEDVAIVRSSSNAYQYERAVDSSTFEDIKAGDRVSLRYREAEEHSNDLHWYVVSVARE